MIEKTYATLRISAARHQRMRLFWRMIESLPTQAVHIVDLGGVGAFWQVFGIEARPQVQVTVVNLEPHPPICPQVRALVADVFDVDRWTSHPIDIVFSNSLIEHLGTPAAQRQFAEMICRNATNYFVQTPNYYFPVEPHFMVPAFQYLPVAAQVWLTCHFSLGWMPKASSRSEAVQTVKQIHLLSQIEFQRLFPDAAIWREKYLGLVKSFVAIGGRWRDALDSIQAAAI